MKVVHLFDRYLPSTMNWAFHLLRFTPEVETSIAAPLIFSNPFRVEDFQYHYSPLQWQRKEDEWNLHVLQRMVASLDFRIFQMYRRSLVRQWKQAKPDLLHAHFGNVACRYLPLVERLDIPLVVSFYGYDYAQAPHENPALRKEYQQLFQKAAAVLVAGPNGIRMLQALGCPDEKIHVLPLGIIPDKIPFSLREKPEGRLHLLQAATVTEKKGHLYTLEAFRRFHEKCPNSSLTFVGEVDDASLFRKLQAGLSDAVQYLPFVPYADFHSFMATFDLFVHPSCTAANRDCEGSAPIVLLDAQASGLPVLASDHCDIPEEVIHGRTGWIVPERSVEELAAGMEYFYKLPEGEFASFSRRARAHVENNFDIRHSGPALWRLYQTIAQSS